MLTKLGRFYFVFYQSSQSGVGYKSDVESNMSENGFQSFDLSFELLQELELEHRLLVAWRHHLEWRHTFDRMTSLNGWRERHCNNEDYVMMTSQFELEMKSEPEKKKEVQTFRKMSLYILFFSILLSFPIFQKKNCCI